MAYRATVGFNYPDDSKDAKPGAEIRVEAGSVIDSLPEQYAASILEQGCVEEIIAPSKKKLEDK